MHMHKELYSHLSLGSGNVDDLFYFFFSIYSQFSAISMYYFRN